MTHDLAVCMQCGRFKKAALETCDHCGFRPHTAPDIARSRILGPPRDFELCSGRVISTGRTLAELERIAQRIQFGGRYEFPRDEMDGLLAVWTENQAMPSWQTVWQNVQRLTPILVAAALFALLDWGMAAG